MFEIREFDLKTWSACVESHQIIKDNLREEEDTMMLSIILDKGEFMDRRTVFLSWLEAPYWETEDDMDDNGLKIDISHM